LKVALLNKMASADESKHFDALLIFTSTRVQPLLSTIAPSCALNAEHWTTDGQQQHHFEAKG